MPTEWNNGDQLPPMNCDWQRGSRVAIIILLAFIAVSLTVVAGVVIHESSQTEVCLDY